MAKTLHQKLFPKKYHNLFVYVFLLSAFVVYSGFVYIADVPEPKSMTNTEDVIKGKLLWQKHNCSSCHQLYGLGGYIGPDLTNIMSEKGKGRAYARAIIKSGTRVMPDFKLKDAEIEALLAFLENADKTGRTSAHDFNMNPDGSISPIAYPKKL